MTKEARKYNTMEKGQSLQQVLLEKLDMCACSVAQSFLTLCNPMDCSQLGSSVHGILQARMLGWVAISSSKGSS